MMISPFRMLGGLLAAGTCLLSAGVARAQMAPDSARLVAKLALVRLVSHAYEVEVEYRCIGPLSVAVAPRVVAGRVPSVVSPSGAAAGDRVFGYGLSVAPRFYIPNTGAEGTRLAGLYVSLIADYQHLRLSYQQEAWGEDLAPNGLRYYVFRPRDFSETIGRTGLAGVLGYQCQVFHPRVRLDTSFGYSSLNSRSSAGAASRYRSSNSDYGYSGSFLALNLSLGVVLR